jgi:hypothetical protein
MFSRSLIRYGMKQRSRISHHSRFLSASTQGSSSDPNSKNPLSAMKEFAESKSLCDEFGFRLPHKHWTFTLAVNKPGDDAPILKTVNFQRVSSEGIDFVIRNNPGSPLFSEKVAFLYLQGKYKTGENVAQWRASGSVQSIPLEWVLSHIPDYSITEIVATTRAMEELQEPAKLTKLSIGGQQSHFIEIIQQVRADLAEGKIPIEELRNSIKAGRFVPENMERMQGGPDDVVWDRWVWSFENGVWREPNHVMPF